MNKSISRSRSRSQEKTDKKKSSKKQTNSAKKSKPIEQQPVRQQVELELDLNNVQQMRSHITILGDKKKGLRDDTWYYECSWSKDFEYNYSKFIMPLTRIEFSTRKAIVNGNQMIFDSIRIGQVKTVEYVDKEGESKTFNDWLWYVEFDVRNKDTLKLKAPWNSLDSRADLCKIYTAAVNDLDFQNMFA